jgi:hypothetical protein
MKTGLSFVTLTGAAVLALGATAAQARMSESQAATAQTHAAKKVAMWYQAEAKLFQKAQKASLRSVGTSTSVSAGAGTSAGLGMGPDPAYPNPDGGAGNLDD